MLLLSVFPGVDLLGMAFEAEGFCVVRAPDKILGGDIRRFHPPAGVFDGVIGGPPCQDFSRARRTPRTGDGLAMLKEFERVVLEARPLFYLAENVPSVPDIKIEGYTWQRLDLRDDECGGVQKRIRHFQFGSREGKIVVVPRGERLAKCEPAALASEGARVNPRGWERFCLTQGLKDPLHLPDFTRRGRYKVVGNGVPLNMGRVIARSVNDQHVPAIGETLCACGCGRLVTGRAKSAGAACRKRLQKRRERA